MFNIPLGSLFVRLAGDDSQFRKMLDNAEGRMTAAGEKMQKWGKSLTTHVTLPLAGIGAAAVKSFADWDDAMTKSLAIMPGVSAEMREQMEALTLEISQETTSSATDLAKAYYYLASAGLSAEQSMAALPMVEKFATAGAFELEAATSYLADAQSALGMRSQDAQENLENMTRVADVLIQASIIANANTEEFSKALTTKSAAALRNMGKSVEEGVAVLAAFADQGLKGEAAGEALHIVLRDLQNAANNNVDAWNQLGMRIYDANCQMLPLADIIEQLEGQWAGLSDQEKDATAELLGFQDRSFAAIQSLLGVSGKIREYEDSLRSAAGVTESVANEQLKSFSSQLTILWHKIQAVAIEIGGLLVPYIMTLVEWVEAAVKWWRGLSKGMKDLIVIAGMLAASLGPVLWMIGLTAKGLGGVIGSMGLLFSKATWVSAGWAAAIGVIVASLAILADVFLQVFGLGELGLTKMINSVRIGGQEIGTTMTSMWLEVFYGWSWVSEAVETLWIDLKGKVLDVMDSLGAALRDKFKYYFGPIADFVKEAAEDLGISGLFGAFGELFSEPKGYSTKGGFGRPGKILSTPEAKAAMRAQQTADVHSYWTERRQNYLDAIRNVNREDEDRWAAHLQEQNKAGAGLKIPEMPTMQEIAEPAVQEAADMAAALSGLSDLPEAVAEIPEAVQEAVDLPQLAELPQLTDSMASLQREGQFQQIALRRFALEGPGGLAREYKQEVRAKGVEDRLDTLIDVTKSRTVVATLG